MAPSQILRNNTEWCSFACVRGRLCDMDLFLHITDNYHIQLAVKEESFLINCTLYERYSSFKDIINYV